MADNTNRLAGVAYLSVDGRSFMLAGDLKYQVSGVKRESLVGLDRVHGYSEMPVPGYIECAVRDAGTLKMADINAMTNVTVVAELANGKTIVLRGGWTVESPPDVETAEAKATIRWESNSVVEA